MHEDWRLMNCLNFVFRPAGFASHEDMDALYNRQVRRFYGRLGYRLRFARRIWEHRWSLGHIVRDSAGMLRAARYFSANRARREVERRNFPPHPRQPRNLRPLAESN
jgi:hypothetical protein